MNEKNYMFRALAMLIVLALALVGFYFLPEKIEEFSILDYKVNGFDIERLDILSDIRGDEQTEELAITDNSILDNSSKNIENTNISDKDISNEDKTIHIEDIDTEYIVDESDLSLIPFHKFGDSEYKFQNFINKLISAKETNSKIRIAVLGDSFIEGDIFVEGIREKMQERFGGSGVGLIPLTSIIRGFRNSVDINGSNWKSNSILNAKNKLHTIMGEYFTPQSSNKSTLSLKGDRITDQALFYYSSSPENDINISIKENGVEAQTLALDVMGDMQEKQININPFNKISFSLSGNLSDFRSYGIALEGNSGVVVDAMSVRGSSGLHLSSAINNYNQEFLNLRNYDMIILEYGLNVVSTKQKNYSSYRDKMINVVTKLQAQLGDNALIMIMGASDRGVRKAGNIESMKEIELLEKEQIRVASNTSSIFWSTRLAMKASGGIKELQKTGAMAKDYTHLSHKGGRIIANKWFEALENELNK